MNNYGTSTHVAPVDPLCQAQALADSIAASVRLARILSEQDRTVDLDGLDEEAGLLCAAVLDLAPASAHLARPQLHALLAEIDRLEALLRHRGWAHQETGHGG